MDLQHISAPIAYDPAMNRAERQEFFNIVEQAEKTLNQLRLQEFLVYVRDYLQDNLEIESLIFYHGHEHTDEGLYMPVGMDVEYAGYTLADSYYGVYVNDKDETQDHLAEEAQDVINHFGDLYQQTIEQNSGKLAGVKFTLQNFDECIEKVLGVDGKKHWDVVLEQNKLNKTVTKTSKISKKKVKI